MPKIVDHEQRREELAAAVWRLASRDGLDAVTIRGVSAEAGWSTGALHHYFSDKEELLLFAFQTVADRVGRRVATAREEASEPLELARALLAVGLPLARAQRLAYDAWRRIVADALRDARDRGDIEADVDVEREAAALVALVDGLAVQASFDPGCLDVGLVDERLAELQRAPAR